MPQRVKASDPSSTALKSLTILELLAPEREGMGLNEITRSLEGSRASVLRLLAALVEKNMVLQDPVARHYKLTLRLLELGTMTLEHVEFQEAAREPMEELSRTSGETVHLGVLSGPDIVFVGKAEPPSPIRLHSRVGARAPGHCTSLGKVLLAALPEKQAEDLLGPDPLARFTPHTIIDKSAFMEHLLDVRRLGYGTDREEHREGITCVGAPIVNYRGDAVAAISISGPTFRMDEEIMARLTRLVVETARQISKELGSRARGA